MPGPRVIVVALASLLAAAPVMAQPKSPNRPPQDVANDLVKQAIMKSQAGEHLAAIDLYLAAYSLIPQHTLLSNVGSEYQQAGKPVDALRYFCMYLEKDPTGTNATYATAKAKALQIELGNKSGEVCKPQKKDPTPEPPPRDPPPPPPPQPPPGGEPRDTGGSPGGALKLTGIAVGVVGLVGLGIGTYYGIQAQKKSDLLTNHDIDDEWPSNIQEQQRLGQVYEDRQILLTIAGGGLTAVGVVLYIVGATRTSPKKETISVRTTSTPTSVGIVLGGSF